MDRAKELHRSLADQLNALAQTGMPRHVGMDLSGASDVDACGCQLLTLFAEHLRRIGSAASIQAGTPEELRERIGALGFAALLAGPPAEPSAEAPMHPAKEIA